MKLPKEMLDDIMRRTVRDTAVCIVNNLTRPFCDGKRIIATDGRIVVAYDGDRDELPDDTLIGKQGYVASEVDKYLKEIAEERITDNLNTVDSMLRFEAYSLYSLALAKRMYAGTNERYQDYALIEIEGHYFRAEYILQALHAFRASLQWCGAPTVFFCKKRGFLRMKNERVSVLIMEVLPNGSHEMTFIPTDGFKGFIIVDGDTGSIENEEAVSDCIATNSEAE